MSIHPRIHLHNVVINNRARQLAAVAAFAIGMTAMPAVGAGIASSNPVEVVPYTGTTEFSARRKPKRAAQERRRVRPARVWRARSHARAALYRAGREASLVPELRALIAELRQRHGADSVRVISGRDRRAHARSCHPLGQAFDAHVTRAVMADLRTRRFGLITYSGGMNHVHVSSCAREAGLRAHKRISGRDVYARAGVRAADSK